MSSNVVGRVSGGVEIEGWVGNCVSRIWGLKGRIVVETVGWEGRVEQGCVSASDHTRPIRLHQVV